MRIPLLLILLSGLSLGQVAEFHVRETAGLRRFGYPVRAKFKTGKPAGSLRLLERGRPVPAQLTALEEDLVEVDFTVDHGPLEVRSYRVEEGTGPAVSAGLEVRESASSLVVLYPGGLEFQVPKNLLGLLDAVRNSRVSYLGGGSQGLALNYRDDIEYRAGGIGHWGERTRVRIVKRGPLAALLRFDSLEGLRGNRSVKSVVEIEFPRSKSWVEVRWTVEDPELWVSGLMADLELSMEGEPILADFGAGTMVYAALRRNQPALFWAGLTPEGRVNWGIDVGGRSYAAGSGMAEGWAHIMDSRRAVAVAVSEFARFAPTSRDSIEISPAGRLRVRRDFSRGREKSLNFWLHFVDMPVHVGAATSAQSMQSPLKVEWK